MPFLAIWRQFCVIFQSMLSLAYESVPRCFSCSAASNFYSVCMANLLCCLLHLTCMNNDTVVCCVFSGLFFGKGGVAELFTKQLCFIGSHKVVQYLVNCFCDHQVIPAFWKQMRDTSYWLNSFLKVSSE